MTVIKINEGTAAKRGERLKQLREMAALSSEVLAHEAGLSRGSVSCWENATYNGLSHKGAEKVIEVFKKRGVNCSVEWLLLGLGAKPSCGVAPRPDAMHREIALFTSLYADAIVLQVMHNKIAPYTLEGDYVGGLLEPFEKIWKDTVVDNYIVQSENVWDVKRIQGNLLSPKNLIQSAAKIIRIWRQ